MTSATYQNNETNHKKAYVFLFRPAIEVINCFKLHFVCISRPLRRHDGIQLLAVCLVSLLSLLIALCGCNTYPGPNSNQLQETDDSGFLFLALKLLLLL